MMFQYEEKFSDLARFAPSIIETEHMKCIRFEDGLKASIRRQIVALEIREYARLVSAALPVEQDSLAYQKERAEKGESSG